MIRRLKSSDYVSYLELLSQLSHVGTISEKQFNNFLSLENNNFFVLVFEDYNKIVSCLTVLIEPKLIHSASSVMHIEDVVTHEEQRGKGFSSMLIEKALELAKSNNCYKVILNCKDDKVNFYSKFGFKKQSNQMRKDII
jgi:glucosamine-phosphate N-acetyltransferase